MKQISQAVKICALAVALVMVAPAVADQEGTQEGVKYVSGGVGLDSEARLNARASEFNLKLIFTLKEGNYLADVNVVVADAKGRKLVEHLADGPFFMAKLPAGQYNVVATYDGKAETRKVAVGSGLRTEYFRWASNPLVDNPTPRAAK